MPKFNKSTVTQGHHIIGYCDGSCPVSGGPGGWGVVLLDGDVKYEGCGGEAVATNNTMELQAAIELVKFMRDGEYKRATRILVVCDSQYVVNGIHEWRKKWERTGFHKVKNVEQWQTLFEEVDYFKHILFAWARGHNGHEYNELADRLADEGRRRGK
jgi:ribonuclease HI